MIFTTNRRFAKQSEPPPYIESPMMTFSNKFRTHTLQKMPQLSIQKPLPQMSKEIALAPYQSNRNH